MLQCFILVNKKKLKDVIYLMCYLSQHAQGRQTRSQSSHKYKVNKSKRLIKKDNKTLTTTTNKSRKAALIVFAFFRVMFLKVVGKGSLIKNQEIRFFSPLFFYPWKIPALLP